MLWGGRFKDGLSPEAMSFSTSFGIDRNLFNEDLLVNKAHTEMLFKVGIIDQDEFNSIIKGLEEIEKQLSSGKWMPEDNDYEDVHSAIESKLTELIGHAAGKMHTGRSRNDQIATGIKLWIKKACNVLIKRIQILQNTLLTIAEDHVETIIPGYTHVQRAQPISFAFHLIAYIEMLQRDIKRLEFVLEQSDVCPLGAGALAGSTLALDRKFTAEKLGFSKVSANSLDSVSDRDFLIDFLNTCVVGMMHLSRLCEEVVIWSSAEWNFIRLHDNYSTGSSLMPQKKNPDMAELIRGKSGRVYGNYMALAVTMKGLPLSYNRDMQEDKEGVFDSFNTYSDSLNITAKMIGTMKINENRFTDDLKNDFMLATDLADWLVMKGIPFREAHHLVGKVVAYAEDNKIAFGALTIDDLNKISAIFDKSALYCLDINTSLNRKKTYGSPNPHMVREQISIWKRILA